MALQAVAQGGPLELLSLVQFEPSFAEGQRGQLSLELRWPLDDDTLQEVYDRLTGAGVEEAGVTQAGNTLNIGFRKGIAPLALLAAVIAIVLVALVVSWVLFREVGGWVGPALALAIVGGGLLVALGIKDRIAGERRR